MASWDRLAQPPWRLATSQTQIPHTSSPRISVFLAEASSSSSLFVRYHRSDRICRAAPERLQNCPRWPIRFPRISETRAGNLHGLREAVSLSRLRRPPVGAYFSVPESFFARSAP